MSSPMSFLRLFASTFAISALAACSSASSGDPRGESLSGGPGGESLDTTNQTTSTSNDGGSPASCSQISGWTETNLAAAIATADVACTVDSDCVVADNSTTCSDGCGVIVSKAGAVTVAAAVAAESVSTCKDSFGPGKCTVEAIPCAFPGPAACVANKCTSPRTSPWSSLELGANTEGLTLPRTCSDAGCQTWTVTPDAAITVVTAGVSATKTLSDADFSAIDGILRSAEFATEETSVGSCITSPGAVYVSIDVVQAGVPFTDCISGGADYQKLYDIVKAY